MTKKSNIYEPKKFFGKRFAAILALAPTMNTRPHDFGFLATAGGFKSDSITAAHIY